MDVLGLGALGLVATEWMALGWLGGVEWPRSPSAPAGSFWAPRWALRLLAGACLTGLSQLVLAMIGPGFGSIPVVLACASVGAAGVRSMPRWYRPRAAARVPRLSSGGPEAELASTEGRDAERPSARSPEGERPPGRGSDGDPPEAMGWPERTGWLLLALVLVSATTRAVLVPEAGWDAFSHWGLRAQAYALAGTIVDAHSEHDYYPPLVPLLEAWLYLHRGLASIDLGKGVSALIGSAFGVCLAWHVRLSVSPPWLAPWLGTAILAATTALLDSFWTGQADLSLTAYFSLATLALLQWKRAPGRAWLVQAALFAAAAGLTKLEGFPRIGLLGVAIVLDAVLTRQRRLAEHALAALLVVVAGGIALLAWSATAATHGISSNAEHLGQFQPLAVGSVLVSLASIFGGVRTGGGVVAACLAWAVAGRSMFTGWLRLVSLVVLGELAGTLLGFLLSSTSPDVEVRTSATRLFEQFLPLALFAGAVGVLRVRL